MNLDLGQWAAVATIVATHCPNPDLIAAVDAELARARDETKTSSQPEITTRGFEGQHGTI